MDISIKKVMVINSALVIINCINKYFDHNGEKYIGNNCQEVVRNIHDKLVIARKAGNPVIYLNNLPYTPDTKKQKFNFKIKEAVKPVDGEYVIHKETLSAFYNTSFESIISQKNISEIVLVGAYTNTDVFFAALEAKIRGLAVMVFEKCVISDDRIANAVFLNEMNKNHGIDVF